MFEEIIHTDTGRKLNVHKTFRRPPGRLLNVFCTLSLRPVSAGNSFPKLFFPLYLDLLPAKVAYIKEQVDKKFFGHVL